MSTSEIQANDISKQLTDAKRRHFVAGILRWLMSFEKNENIDKELVQRCKELADETEKLENLPSEDEKKASALLGVMPGAALFWVGLYTGIFWLIPGTALGLAGSYLISDSIARIFSTGKEARFFRTLIYYLLRMENADGVISSEELASLRAVIEFIPTSAQEKQKWLEATKTPDGYHKLAPDTNLTEEEKERIMSACWSLALCDGLDSSETQMFSKIGLELDFSDEELGKIKDRVESQINNYQNELWQILEFALYLNPHVNECKNELYSIFSLVAMKPITEQEFANNLNKKTVADIAELKSRIKKDLSFAIAAWLIARSCDLYHVAAPEELEKKFTNIAGKDVFTNSFSLSFEVIDSSLQLFQDKV